MFSNRYTFIYAAILAIAVAAVLSIAALTLQPFQEKNAEIEKIQNLLSAINVESTTKNAEKLYAEYFTEELGIDKDGNVVCTYKDKKLEGSVRPFDIDLKTEQHKRKTGEKAVFPLYVYNKDGKQGYVVPLLGNGLWGPVWGNLAFDADFKTIVGANFGHKGETPGLGAEIALPPFQNSFINKRIFDDNNEFKPVVVKKAANKNSSYEVDAISGGTITSNGVSDMIYNDLSFYQPYIQKILSK